MGDYIFCLAGLPVVAWGVWVCAREPRPGAGQDTRDLWAGWLRWSHPLCVAASGWVPRRGLLRRGMRAAS